MLLITPPDAEPVTLAEAKLHLRVDHDDEDTLIGMLIKVARQQAEQRTGRRYGIQTWERSYDAFPPWALMLPDPPLVEIVSVKYDDPAGVEQTLGNAAYVMRRGAEPAVLLPASVWPATIAQPGAVRVRYRCGLDSSDARWDSLKAWMLLAIGTWHAQRQAASPVQTYALPHEFWHGLLDPLVFYGTYTR